MAYPEAALDIGDPVGHCGRAELDTWAGGHGDRVLVLPRDVTEVLRKEAGNPLPGFGPLAGCS